MLPLYRERHLPLCGGSWVSRILFFEMIFILFSGATLCLYREMGPGSRLRHIVKKFLSKIFFEM